MTAPKPFRGFPEFLSAVLGALHRYEVSIYSQGQQLGRSYHFLAIKCCIFYNSNRRGKKELDLLEFGG
jgi:hypothetical protein